MHLDKNNDITLLSINNYYYRRGGAEFVFLEQNQMFDELGWNVIPFSMQHPDNLDSNWSEYFVDEIEFGNQYSLVKKLALVPKIIYSTEAKKKLGRLLSEVKPNVCHAHNIYHHLSPSILSVLKQHNIPTVITLHDLKLACPAYKMLTHDGICERCNHGSLLNIIRHKCIKDSTALSAVVYLEALTHKILRSYINNVDKFIVPSKFYLEKFIEWGFNRDQFTYIPNFVELERYKPNFSAGNSFLYFGRLGHEKGLMTFLQAAKHANVSVCLAGTGPDKEALQQRAKNLGVDATFLGFLSGEKLYDAIRSARAVVLPSEWYENAPISVLESYALGTPVIGANIGGIGELIRDGETGLCFSSGSAEELATSLKRLAEESDNNIENMGRKARTWVESEFTAELFRSRLINLYKSIGVSIK